MIVNLFIDSSENSSSEILNSKICYTYYCLVADVLIELVDGLYKTIVLIRCDNLAYGCVIYGIFVKVGRSVTNEAVGEAYVS
jgi:hypothetical protein